MTASVEVRRGVKSVNNRVDHKFLVGESRLTSSVWRLRPVGSHGSYPRPLSKEVQTVDAVTTARLAADAIADKKGQDIVLLEVGDLFIITEVFVIGTGTSRPHVQTLAEQVEENLAKHGRKPLRDEGLPEAEWVLLDYGDLMVHLFQPSARAYYDLERLWRDAPLIEWSPAVSDA